MANSIIVFDPTWLTTDAFADVEPICMYHKEQEENPQAPIDIVNYHVLARAHVTRGDADTSQVVRISADDYYKLYVNGELVAQGPAPAFIEHYYYNTVDITPYLHSGENTLAVHVYYQGLLNRVWGSADGRCTLAADVLCLRPNGTVASRFEPSWRYTVSDAYGMGDTVGYETQFLENFDSNKWNEDWAEERFDDSYWKPMVEAKWADYTLQPQPTKMLEFHRLAPHGMQTIDAANFADTPQDAANAGNIVRIDFGREITAGLVLRAYGHSGEQIIIRCGEELNDDGSVRFDMRCNCRYEETWTLAEGFSMLDQYDYKSFRYVELVVPKDVELQGVHALERHYPIDKALCRAEASDKWIKPVFDICKRGVELGTQEAYLDCPSREKGQYLGDSVVISRSQVWLTGTTEMLEKGIEQFAQTAELIDDGLMGVSPGSFMQEIADFSLLWSQMLLTHYGVTGDTEFLARYYPVAKGVLDHFSRYQRADGLLEQVADKWNLVDWPENLRDGYDFELSRPIVAPGCHNVINALWCGAAKTLSHIEDILGIKEHAYDWKAFRASYQKAFFRSETGLFVDSESSSHSALHSNMYALFFDLCPAGSENGIADFMLSKGLCCGVMLSYFYLKGLVRIGRFHDVFETLVNESEHGWVNMIREGATTCWEAWGRDQKWNTSLCHAWAAAPIPVLIEDIAGMVPDPSKKEGFRFEPHVPRELESFDLWVPFRGTEWHIHKDAKNGEVVCHNKGVIETGK